LSLRALVDDAAALLQLRDASALDRIAGALDAGWPSEAASLLAAEWRAQLVGAAALVLGSGEPEPLAALWQAVDGASWAAPQLVGAAFVSDAAFEGRAEERLLGTTRRPPKTIGALVRAYHRLPAPRLAVAAQLSRHDRLMTAEEAQVGVRGVDAWLDRLPALCAAPVQARWRRRPRQSSSRSS
jgi:hypothetical protein